jgi:23S rRNA (pseudouridine1915-N3)-methyltransferase
MYTVRLSKVLPIEWLHPKPSDKETESAAILKSLSPSDYVVLLDERGTDFTSLELAQLISPTNLGSHKRLVIVIGGAYGVTDTVRTQAHTVWRMSRLVFPHMLMRLLVVEQLYRSTSILSGGKYHHA